MTLIEFLTARLDEDEAAARKAAYPGAWHRDGISSVEDSDERLVIYGDGPSPTAEQADHIARHDPARVLAEVDAKRRILAYRDQAARAAEKEKEPPEAGVFHRARISAYDATLRALALPYASHPSYNEAWRP